MNNQELIQKASTIFGSIDKWNAFLELEKLHQGIKDHWLAIGTKRLRDYFTEHPSKSWSWEQWGCLTDTRWHLKDFRSGIAIGFGWQYKGFYLYLNDPDLFDTKQIDEQLISSEYAKLLTPFGGLAKPYDKSGWQIKAEEQPNFLFESI